MFRTCQTVTQRCLWSHIRYQPIVFAIVIGQDTHINLSNYSYHLWHCRGIALIFIISMITLVMKYALPDSQGIANSVHLEPLSLQDQQLGSWLSNQTYTHHAKLVAQSSQIFHSNLHGQEFSTKHSSFQWLPFPLISQTMKKVVLRKVKQNILNNNTRTLG